jgi:hypothetical protein
MEEQGATHVPLASPSFSSRNAYENDMIVDPRQPRLHKSCKARAISSGNSDWFLKENEVSYINELTSQRAYVEISACNSIRCDSQKPRSVFPQSCPSALFLSAPPSNCGSAFRISSMAAAISTSFSAANSSRAGNSFVKITRARWRMFVSRLSSALVFAVGSRGSLAVFFCFLAILLL